MHDVAVWYLLITLSLLGLLAVVVLVQSLGDFVRRATGRAVRRAVAADRTAVDGWTSQPV